MNSTKEFNTLAREFKEDLINELLTQCTEAQQNLFARMYPNGVEGIPDERLHIAYAQCKRTLENAQKK